MKERSFIDSNVLIYTHGAKISCIILYSEDMQHGQKVGDVRIVNPFRPN